jgi:hypothetical protein
MREILGYAGCLRGKVLSIFEARALFLIKNELQISVYLLLS